jgi:hypothetical protein
MKYKISRSNINEFFGFLGKAKTPDKLQKVIDNDPILQKLAADIKKINAKYGDDIDRMKVEDPETFKMLQSVGMIPKDR